MTTIRPSKPHFFKPVLPGSLQEISIPKAFFREYLLGEKCGGRATLRTNRSRSKSWSVKIRGLCFKEGWEEFVRAHDLRVGEVLVFRHEGGFKFHVIVFDYTACEKQYPQIQENEQKMAQAKAGEKKVNREFAKKKTTLQIRDGCPVNRRMCNHCRTDSTPGWRIGPMGRNTLCNACGIRYRQGKLAPEYRPICSPSHGRS